jgi:hypothetical protein
MRRLLPLLLFVSLHAWAQNQSDNLQPLPAVPPPPPEMEPFDAAMEPEVVIKKEPEQTIEEYRIKGHLYMIKVTPKHAPAYYLIDQKGDGSFVRSDNVGPVVQPPMWIIGTF